MSSPLIEEGLAALGDGDAATAHGAFELALGEGESGEVLEGLAEALYLEHEYVASAAYSERAFSAYRREHGVMELARALSERSPEVAIAEAEGRWRTSSGWRPPGTPTPPGRCCASSVRPSGSAPRGSAR